MPTDGKASARVRDAVSRILVVFFLSTTSVMGAGDKMSDANRTADAVETVLNADALQRYYHFDTSPERIPLRLKLPKTAAGIDRVSVHGHPTKQVSPDTTVEPGAADAPFVFETLIVDPNLAYAEFQYPAEGLIGDAFMKREVDQWKLLSVTVGER